MIEKPPLTVRFLSGFSLLISFVLIGLFLYGSYLIWDIIFYILSVIMIIGFAYRTFIKDNGILLKRKENPKLFKIIDSVSKSVGTRVPNKVLLIPNSSIGVTGIFERKLLIGIATLGSLSIKELTAILFHEFAHFKGLDNVVGTSLMKTMFSIKDIVNVSGYTHIFIYIPLLIFYYIFFISTMLYSRQREYMADWMASSFVGGNIFSKALEKYITLSQEIEKKSDIIVQHYGSKNMIVENIYDMVRNSQFTKSIEEDINSDLIESYNHSSIFSTHPSINSRVSKISKVKGDYKLSSGECSSLFKDLRNEEIKATDIIYKKILEKK